MLYKKIKPFKTIACFNNKFYNINEKDFLKKWNILFFIPFSYSLLCSLELKEISFKKKFFNKEIEIYIITTDNHLVQKNWLNNLKINNLILISDFNHKISKNLNILNINGNSNKSTIIIDKNLIIRSIEIYDNDIGRSINDINKKINMLKIINENYKTNCNFSYTNESI